MADHTEIVRGIDEYEGVSYPVLVPNLKGLNTAVNIKIFSKNFL